MVISNLPACMPLQDVLEHWEALVTRWSLDPGERCSLLGGFGHGPVGEIETYELLCGEQRMRLVVELAPVLRQVYLSDARIREWLRRPNSNLAGRTPIDVMACSPEWMRWIIDGMGLAT